MVKVFILGKTAENIKATISMIKNKDQENIIGLMVDVSKEDGLMEKDKVSEK